MRSPCPPGCCGTLACANRDRHCKKVFGLVDGTVIKAIPAPALNKWTQTDPAFKQLTFGMGCHQLLRRSIKLARSGRQADADSGSDDAASDDDLLRAPGDDTKTYQKTQRRARQKGFGFVASNTAFVKLLIWVITSPFLMKLHYKWFKHGQSFNAGHIGQDRRNPLFDLCNMETSPAVSVVSSLSQMLFSTHHKFKEHWSLLNLSIGEEWGSSIMLLVRSTLLLMIGNVWRRLVKYFLQWPWPLVPLVDEKSSQEQKRRAAERVTSEPECCLDVGVGRKIKAQARSADQLLGNEDLLCFLTWFFNQIILTSSFIECLFASFRQWMLRLNKPISAASLVRKHVNSRALRIHKFLQSRKTARAQRDRNIRESHHRQCRPLWADRRGPAKGKCKAHSLYVGKYVSREWEVRRAAGALWSHELRRELLTEGWQAWKALSRDEKKRWKSKAQRRRTMFRQNNPLQAMVADLREKAQMSSTAPIYDQDSPWKRGTDDTPIHLYDYAKLVDETPGYVSNKSAAFRKKFGEVVYPDPNFPKTVRVELPCLEKYPECSATIDDDEKAAVEALVEVMRLGVAPVGSKKHRSAPIAPILKFHHALRNLNVFVQILSYKANPFTAECVRIQSPDAHTPPYELTLELGELAGQECVEVIDEFDCCLRVVRECEGAWKVHRLHYDCTPSGPETVIVTKDEIIDERAAKAAQQSNVLVSRALNALKIAKGTKETSRKRRQGEGLERVLRNARKKRRTKDTQINTGHGDSEDDAVRSSGRGSMALRLARKAMNVKDKSHNKVSKEDNDSDSSAGAASKGGSGSAGDKTPAADKPEPVKDGTGTPEPEDDPDDAASEAESTESRRSGFVDMSDKSGGDNDSDAPYLEGIRDDWEDAALETERNERKKADGAQKRESFLSGLERDELDRLYRKGQARPIGRVAGQRLEETSAAAHVACYCPAHTRYGERCSVWVTLRKVKNIGGLEKWIAAQDEYATSADHLRAFDQFAYGTPLKPQRRRTRT